MGLSVVSGASDLCLHLLRCIYMCNFSLVLIPLDVTWLPELYPSDTTEV